MRLVLTAIATLASACAPGGSTSDSAPGLGDSGPAPLCDPLTYSEDGMTCGQFRVLTWLPPPETFPPVNVGFELEQVAGATLDVLDLAAPLAPAMSTVTLSDGTATFLFVLPFDVYACARVPGRVDTCTHWYGASPLAAFVDRAWSVPSADWATLHAAAGVVEDPATGVFMGNVAGTIDSPNGVPEVAGYTVMADSGGVVVYRVNGVPDASAVATDVFGDFDIFGVPPGPVTITATNGTATIVRDVYALAGTAHIVMVPR